MTRNELLDQLRMLLPAQLDEVIFSYGLPPEYIPQRSATIERAITLIKYAKQQQDGLEQLSAIIKSINSPRLSPVGQELEPELQPGGNKLSSVPSDEFLYDVFLSYTSADKPRVRRLANKLKEAGLRVWLDEWFINRGDSIPLAIEHSRTLVLCMSPALFASEWVKHERGAVLFRDPANQERQFIPLLLEDCKIPDSLRQFAYVDWRKENETELMRLVNASALAQYQGRTQKSLNRVRTIFLGYGETGKTSLIRALNRKKVVPGVEPMTPGIEISEWSVPNTEIIAHFWDFGGQVMAHATHQFFMRTQCLYVIVLNARTDINANQQTEYWLEHVRAFGGNAPILIVGNKADLAQVNIDTLRLRDKYPNIIDFYPVSCTQCNGKYHAEFERFQRDFIHQLCELDKQQVRFKDAHFAVLQELRKISATESFLRKTDFNILCDKYKIPESGEQDRQWLLGYLDNLGEISYFPELSTFDEFVLNPRWLTYGVYTLLFSEQARKQSGKLSESDIVNILAITTIDNHGHKLTYPANRCRFIIDAMIAFRLCYRVYDQLNEFIFPDLLPSDRPARLNFDRVSAMRFDFDFEVFLPRHVICNLIVQLNTEIFSNVVWQNGVQLWSNKFNSGALIEADYQSRRLSLWINGQLANRYFSSLYDSVTKPLEIMKDLPYKEWVHLPDSSGRAIFKQLLSMEAHGENSYYHENGLFYKVSDLLKIMPPDKRQEQINYITVMGDYMSNGNKQSITDSTIIGSTLNLGEISGQVQNAVNQMPAATSEQMGIKETLQNLHRLLSSAGELSDEDKAEALKKVQEIAEAAQDPVAGKGIAKTALRFFKGLAADFENAKALAGELMGLVKQIGVFFKVE